MNNSQYFRYHESSKEYEIDRCMKILNLISRVNCEIDKIRDLIHSYKNYDSKNSLIYRDYMYILSRLEKYYNKCTERITKF